MRKRREGRQHNTNTLTKRREVGKQYEKKYWLFDGTDVKAITKVEAVTLEDAQRAINEILGGEYDWHEVSKDKDTYYDYSIQDEAGRVIWFRLKRVLLGGH